MTVNNSVSIVPYKKLYQQDFKQLNQSWIEKYFTLEKADLLALNHPETYILQKGGFIAMAIFKNKVVGTAALLKSNIAMYDFELAKMGVHPKHQKMGIGALLGQYLLNHAKQLGAKAIYLESNKKLAPALKLYRKLGFKEIDGLPSPYARSDIQMGIQLV